MELSIEAEVDYPLPFDTSTTRVKNTGSRCIYDQAWSEERALADEEMTTEIRKPACD